MPHLENGTMTSCVKCVYTLIHATASLHRPHYALSINARKVIKPNGQKHTGCVWLISLNHFVFERIARFEIELIMSAVFLFECAHQSSNVATFTPHAQAQSPPHATAPHEHVQYSETATMRAMPKVLQLHPFTIQ